MTTAQQMVGASPDAWWYLDAFLGLAPDLLPVVSDSRARVRPKSSVDGKIGKVPSLFDQNGLVMGFKNWTDHRTSDADIARWSAERRYSIGVQTRELAAIDIDIEQPELVSKVVHRTETLLGVTLPKRSRANSARCLLACRVVGSRDKVIIPTGNGRIEILGHGQQFVACGMHPSGSAYRWDGDGPSGLPAQIPEVSLEAFNACVSTLAAEFGARPTPLPVDEYDESDALDTLDLVNAETLADLENATLHLASVGYGLEYDDWVWAGNMLKSLGDPGQPLFVAYSVALGNGKPGEAEKKWPDLSADRAGYRAIFAKAQSLGWVNPQKALTVETAIERLRKMPRDEVLSEWAEIAAPMPRHEADALVDEVQRMTGTGRRSLTAALADARHELKRERRRKSAEQRAANRIMMVYRPEDTARQSAQIGAAILDRESPEALLSFGGIVSQIVEGHLAHAHLADHEDLDPPPTLHVRPHTETSLRGLIENNVLICAGEDDDPKPIAVPKLLIDPLLEENTADAPALSGLLTHPIVLSDGTILSTNGLHKRTGLFLCGVVGDDYRPYTHEEAKAAWRRLRATMLEGFEFGSGLNESIALSGLVTGVQRRLLDMAPGLALLAAAQSSGKTTYLRVVHVILTGRDIPVTTLPLGNEAEIEKRLLSLLMQSPAMIAFDNIPDGYTVHSGSLSASMTSATFEGRILGVSRMASVPTNVLVSLSGNNLTFGADEISRWLVARLAPQHARPEERQFKHRDILAHARASRAAVLRDVVGIVAGFIRSGERMHLSGTRFPKWDRMVRQPLIWAGADDVAQSFRVNESESEHAQALRALLLALREVFPDQASFYAKDVVDAASGWNPDPSVSSRLVEALQGLGVKDVRGAKSIGRVLSAKSERTVLIEEETGESLRLCKQVDRNSMSTYMLVR
ncbi:bifunctional DNA primase/polymerase [Variovorax paradoxus]|nr:bifunctional DNA primase/polymerase [Variovorax paradoxus]MBT2304696.1 bifunctional DNA primase/polymerase [Variovorax paradoxus]